MIYTPQLDECRAFYEGLGLDLDVEWHGDGPVHYAAVLSDGSVFELYPAEPGRETGAVRMGFTVGEGDGHGYAAGVHVVRDPDGRSVELRVTPAL
ncbi:hypothetical protein SAMN05421505_12568 [Sinosporangium album]|uniref:Glyoxalase/Bleomycin resistance protein/Dioxygenase superfamily protein n=1 Tax=Sinosporangium album TaxID=504805 RepID=A0A1G8G3C0_9ACTN|nr:hypothetical protein SAMN05421505_12568 [Sinosporangium album]